MSTMLEQAIVDAKALREAAVKSAEAAIVEKYNDEVKDAVSKLLEQDDISLEQSIENFEKGVKVAKYCERKLKDAEDKVKAILDQTDPQ